MGERPRVAGSGRIAAALGVLVALIATELAVASAAARSASQSAPPLQLGSRGSRVATLQRRLIVLGYLPVGAADGTYGQRTWHAVVAFQGWQRLPRDGEADSRTLTELQRATRPRPWVPLPRALELDISRQVLLVVVDGRVSRAIHSSTARPGFVTPRGRFRVFERERLSWSKAFHVWMPYALYFSGGYAIHGFDTVPAYPASHGCVRIPLVEAPYVYAAAPLGTPVLIR